MKLTKIVLYVTIELEAALCVGRQVLFVTADHCSTGLCPSLSDRQDSLQ